MSTPINLNKRRKALARAEKKARADRNAVAFGRSKVEKEAEKAASDKARQLLDGHKRAP